MRFVTSVLAGHEPHGSGAGVAAVFTPKDYDLMAVIDRVLDVIGAPAAESATRAASA